jgi:hypothetical protein
MAVVYFMSFQYSQLASYVNSYQVGLGISVLILAVSFVVKVANKYLYIKSESFDKKE